MTYRKQIRTPRSDDPILLMDAPIGIATTAGGDIAALVGVVVVVMVLVWLFARLPGAVS